MTITIEQLWLLVLAVVLLGALAGTGIVWRKLKRERRAAVSEQTFLRMELEQRNNELEQTRQALNQEQVFKAAAEERCSRLTALEEQLKASQDELFQARTMAADYRARLEEEHKAFKEKARLMENAELRLREAFDALSAQALQSNNASFLALAQKVLENYQTKASHDLELRQQKIDDLVRPMRESLQNVDGNLKELEKSRSEAYVQLREQVRELSQGQGRLQSETANLVKALRSPVVRGRWGEVQLKNVVQLAGMLNYCDFEEQKTHTTEDGRLRPDMIVRLPNDKRLVVDAKCPLEAYLDAVQGGDDDERIHKLKEHARQVKNHVQKLAGKDYARSVDFSPEFVVMFLPGESFFSAALEQDPQLLEFGFERNVVLATPTTLISLLKAVAHGWRQENLAENARKISKLGSELYDRLRIMGEHMVRMGKGLNQAVESYNQAVGSVEKRVMVSARRFKELDDGLSGELPELNPIAEAPRMLEAPEFAPALFAEPDQTVKAISAVPDKNSPDDA